MEQEKRICLECNNEFDAFKHKNTRWCSKECYKKHITKDAKIVKCNTCGTEIRRAKWQQRIKKNYCSVECANEGFRKKKVELKCNRCNKIYYVPPCRTKKSKFCSTKCSALTNLDKINSRKPKHSGTKPELEFMEILDELNIKYKHQYSVQWKHGWKKWYDFCLLDYNILVEVDGVYWHGKNKVKSELNEQQMKTRSNDKLKNKLAKDNGYKLIRLWSDELDEFMNLKLDKI